MKFPTYLAHPVYTNMKLWQVSHFDGHGGWQNTGKPVSREEALKLAANARRRLRSKK